MIYHTYFKLTVFLVLLLISAGLLQTLFRKTSPVSRLKASALLIVLLTASILCRALYIQTSEVDVDTSTWLSAAISFHHYPSKLWVLLNYSDSRPLTVLPLVIATSLGFPATYLMSEIVGILLWIGTIYILYRLIAVLGSRSNALILTWGLCLFFSTISYGYSAYNSEHVSILMLTLAFAGYVAYLYEKWDKPVIALLLGILLGSLVFAKFQNVPMGMLTALFLVIEMTQRRSWKNMMYLVGGAIFPTLLVNLYFASISRIDVFWNNYFWNNFYYSYTTQFSPMPVWERFGPLRIYRFLIVSTNASYFFVTLAIVTLVGIAVNRADYFRKSKKKQKLLLIGLLLVLASIYSVLQAGNNFDHYKLYLVIPGVFFTALMVSSGEQKTQKYLLTLLILGCLVQTAVNLNRFAPIDLPKHVSALDRKVVSSVKAHSNANDGIVVWGWRDELYVKTGRPMGYRDTHTVHFAMASPLVPSWTRDFLEDLESNTPKLFIDAAIPGYSNGGEDLLSPHEKTPGVNAYIKQKYQLIEVHDGVRIFKRIEK
jgi:hypothetical protein